MATLTVYEKPTCTTCKRVHTALVDAGVNFDDVDYYVQPLSKTKLKELVKKMQIPASELLRKKAPEFKELGLDDGDRSDDELISLMVEYPDLMQRPIVEKGNKAILARPAERLQEIL